MSFKNTNWEIIRSDEKSKTGGTIFQSRRLALEQRLSKPWSFRGNQSLNNDLPQAAQLSIFLKENWVVLQFLKDSRLKDKGRREKSPAPKRDLNTRPLDHKACTTPRYDNHYPQNSRHTLILLNIAYNTLLPSSWAMANAIAVFPVPGGPTIKMARPDIFLDLMRSTTSPAASRAWSWPTRPPPTFKASPVSVRPRPWNIKQRISLCVIGNIYSTMN